MTNAERIQANNAELREAIGLAESLPDAESDTMVGVWIFNEVLELYDFNFYVNFVLPNVADSLPFYNIYAVGDDLYYVDEHEDYYTPYKNGVWIYPAYRTITITEVPTDAECIALLKANARKATYENGYEDGFAEGEKAILSTYVDWVVSAASNSCIVDFYNDCDYYAHIYVGITEKVSGERYTEEFVLAPHDSYSISTEEMGWQVQGAEWYANATITKFSKDGEE